MIIRLYYAQQLVQQWWRSSHWTSLDGISREIQDICSQEIYNGGYLAVKPGTRTETEWFRCDMTPVLLEDVPKELLVLELINST